MLKFLIMAAIIGGVVVFFYTREPTSLSEAAQDAIGEFTNEGVLERTGRKMDAAIDDMRNQAEVGLGDALKGSADKLGKQMREKLEAAKEKALETTKLAEERARQRLQAAEEAAGQ